MRQNVLHPRKELRLRVFMMDLLSIVPYYDAYLCEALQSQDVSATLGAITYHLDPFCFKKHHVNIRPGLLDVVGRLRLPKTLRRALKLLETLVNMIALAIWFLWRTPDIVHVQYLPLLQWKMGIDFWFLRYSRALGSALVCTVHDILPSDTGETHARTFHKLYNMMDALICHSDAVKQQLITRFAVPADRIRVIPHGPFFHDLASQKPFGSANPEPVVFFQGLIRPYNGVGFLLDAWSEVQGSGVRAKLVIAGNSDDLTLLNSIREKVRELQLENSVELCFKFLSVEEMMSYYQSADIVVYPYKAVTTSGALMTGVAQGKAIIATALPPFLEILQHEKNALLCQHGDTVQLANALVRLINDASLRSRLGAEAAKLNLGRQAWLSIAEQTYDCYRSVALQRAASMVEDRSAA